MNMDLNGKRAIVTGSTAGIGFAIAQSLAEAGAEVTITGRKAEAVASAVAAINQATGAPRATGLAADLATPEGSAALIAAVPDTDILINNLGIYFPKPVFELTDADWAQILQVNLITSARLSAHYAPKMQAKGWGRLIFISSESAQNIPVEMIHYGTSKAALQALSRGYAKALAGTGVTSNAILPGPTRTESSIAFLETLAQGADGSPAEIEARFLADNRPSTLLGRFATPQEVANLCLYVASPLSSATTGAALRVEGGIVESTC